MNPLTELYEISRQSPWIDNLSRTWLTSGRISELKSLGIRGLTSNPTIFANAIANSDAYDSDFAKFTETMTASDAYWIMACSDVANAADILRDTYTSSGKRDGFVSIEVDPTLAHDTSGTVNAAQSLWDKINKPNLMIKIPATIEGLPAITEVLSRGISVNVTLIFGLPRYLEVMKAHIDGLRAAQSAGHELASISSVASFFVSRVDTKLDPILESKGDEGMALRGKVAVAQAQVAYLMHQERYRESDWLSLQEKGAQRQRPLWASTSTKNPEYFDLLYVESLIAPETVNTMPEATVMAFLDHGSPRTAVKNFGSEAKDVLDQLKATGIDLDALSAELEVEGVDSFASSFTKLLDALEDKKASNQANVQRAR